MVLLPGERHRHNVEAHLDEGSHHLGIHLLRGIHPGQGNIRGVVALNHLVVVPGSGQQRTGKVLIAVGVLLRVVCLNTERRGDKSLRVRGALRVVLVECPAVNRVGDGAAHRNILEHGVRRIQVQVHERERVAARGLVTVTSQLAQIGGIHLIARIDHSLDQREVALIGGGQGRNLNLIKLRACTVKVLVRKQAHGALLGGLDAEGSGAHRSTGELLVATKERGVDNAEGLLSQDASEGQRGAREGHHDRAVLLLDGGHQRGEGDGLRLRLRCLRLRGRPLLRIGGIGIRRRGCAALGIRGCGDARSRGRGDERGRGGGGICRGILLRGLLRHAKTPRVQGLCRNHQRGGRLARCQGLPTLEILHHRCGRQGRTVAEMHVVTQNKRMGQAVV